MIRIDSTQGRIGNFWWINSDPGTPIYLGKVKPWAKRWFVLWGTCGYGRTIHVSMEPAA